MQTVYLEDILPFWPLQCLKVAFVESARACKLRSRELAQWMILDVVNKSPQYPCYGKNCRQNYEGQNFVEREHNRRIAVSDHVKSR